MNVITSFNEHGYKRYGRAFIETFLQNWPKSVRLTVFYEGEDFPFTEGLAWRPIEEVEGLPQFMGSLAFPIMQGIVGDKYDINFDARMARKAFMQAHAIKIYGGKVFWIDADSITHSPVPDWFLDRMLPDDKFNCYLGRDGWYYTESGFIGFNANHDICRRFFKNYLGIFRTGAIFTQPGWHDCFAFDAIRRIFPPEHFNDLAKDLPRGTMHPLINSDVGAYLDHKKGNRKESRSSASDLVVPRKEAYWNVSAAS